MNSRKICYNDHSSNVILSIKEEMEVHMEVEVVEVEMEVLMEVAVELEEM